MAGAEIRPRALRKGDLLAVPSPSGPVAPDALRAGIALLEGRGFRVRPPRGGEPHRIFAASDEERLSELRDAFADPEVAAIWPARGGYGLTRLLPELPPAFLREHPKLVIGFSDATALLIPLVQQAGVAAVHGPMVAHELADPRQAPALDPLFELLAGGAEWELPVPRTLLAGRAEGPVTGGCLTVLGSLAGTPAAPRFADSIVLIEDHYEAPQRRIDRPLVQLRQAGAFDGARAIFFGEMHECGTFEEIAATILDCLGDLGIPIGFGAPVGHAVPHFAVPFGTRAELVLAEQGGGTLRGLEPVVTS